MARRTHDERVMSRRHAERRAGRSRFASVDDDRAVHVPGIHDEFAGQFFEGQQDRLRVVACHAHRATQRLVAVALREDFVHAGERIEPVTDAKVAERIAELQAGVGWIDAHRDRNDGQEIAGDEQCEHAPACQPGPAMRFAQRRRSGFAGDQRCAKLNFGNVTRRDDVFGRRRRIARRVGRRGSRVADAMVDAQHALVLREVDEDARRAGIDDIACCEHRAALDRPAVDAHARADVIDRRHGIAQRDPRDRLTAGNARNGDGIARAADGDRRAGTETALTERVPDADGCAQMRSSQRTTSAAGASPGRTLNSRRTSR